MPEPGFDIVAVILIVVGLAVAFWLTLEASLRPRRVGSRAMRLARLATHGRADEARIEARTSGRSFEPLLASLNGQEGRPAVRRITTDLARVALLFFFPVTLVVYAKFALAIFDPSERLAIVRSLFLGLGLLVPSCLTSAAVIIASGRRTARVLRGACLKVLSHRLGIRGGPPYLSGDE